MENIFYKPKHEYNNKLNPVKGYIEQLAQFLSVRKGISKQEATALAVKLFKEKYKDRNIKYFERNDVGDREVKNGSVLQYIKRNIEDKNVLVPTFTSYCHATKKKSIISEFITENVTVRSIAKKEGQKAKAEGNEELAEAKNNEQNGRKIYNNSVSGLFGQSASILYNPTAHSTLTSITRTMTSLSNACNERLIGGNRYTPRPKDVYHMVVYESTYADIDKIKACIEQFNLHIPTVQDTVNCLRYSSDLYFIDESYYNTYIIPYLEGLTPYHLAAICYNGDLYHQRVFNPDFIRNMLGELIAPSLTEEPLEDLSVIKKTHESIRVLAHSILVDKVKGYGVDYEKMNKGGGLAHSILETHNHAVSVLQKYKMFFNTFYMTEIVPINSHRLREMRRRVVVLSDTDSSCFTLDEWVDWYKNGYEVSPTTIALASAITYIASEAIVNQLAILSKSMNVDDEQLDILQMKNEWLWLSISPAEVSKHYFAWAVIQEGSVLTNPELDLKGVHLKNSAVPVEITKHAKNLIESICVKLANNEKLNFSETMAEIISVENLIIDSINKGEVTFFKRSKIKAETAYSQDRTKSPYQRHLFWNDVFGPKYGVMQEPPYDVIKIPTVITSPTKLKAWLESIEDIALRGRLMNWLETFNKKNLPTIYLNLDQAKGRGIPEEILRVIDVKRIVFDCTMQHRILTQMLGVMINENLLLREQFSLGTSV